MKNIFRNNGFCAAMCMAATFSLCSCEEWTEVESLDIHTPTLEEQNPQLYAEYLKSLNAYKASDHHHLIVSFSNVADPIKQMERLTAMPDSLDFIVLNNPEAIGTGMMEEMNKVRIKGTKVGYQIDYNHIEKAWDDFSKDNAELTEEDALAFITEKTNEQLALCDKYQYDGFIVSYKGRSMEGFDGNQYFGRQKTFFNQIKEWRTNHTGHTMALCTEIQFLAPEVIGMVSDFNYNIVMATDAPGGGTIDMQIINALEAGENVKDQFNNANPVPQDRFCACVDMPDEELEKGFWSIRLEDDSFLPAPEGTANWLWKESPYFQKRGMWVLDAGKDFKRSGYRFLRKVINIMNPNK